MTNARRFALDELTLRPGTYFNPQTEIMIVVDDSPDVDHEVFGTEEFDSDEWVLLAEEIPVDEQRRDDLVERFQQAYQSGVDPHGEDEPDLDEELDPLDDEDDDEDEDDELDGVDELELERE